MNFLNLIHAIHRFILKRSVIFGQQELDSTIGHLLLKMATISYGFGLALTTNMTGWSKKAKKSLPRLVGTADFVVTAVANKRLLLDGGGAVQN